MQKQSLNITENIMTRIKSGEVSMKPRWYFVAGSAALIIGLTGLAVLSSFLVSLTAFSLRAHGPMAGLRLQTFISDFPWWAPGLAAMLLIPGIIILRKFDFSYKKNFVWISLAFIFSVILAGFSIDYLGIDNIWSGSKMMRGIYRQYGNNPGRGFGRMINRQNINRLDNINQREVN